MSIPASRIPISPLTLSPTPKETQASGDRRGRAVSPHIPNNSSMLWVSWPTHTSVIFPAFLPGYALLRRTRLTAGVHCMHQQITREMIGECDLI